MPEVVDQLKHGKTGEAFTCRFTYDLGKITVWNAKVRLAHDKWHDMKGGSITGLDIANVVPAVRDAVQAEWDLETPAVLREK